MAEVAVFADIALAEKFLDKLSNKTKTVAEASAKMQRILSPIVFRSIIRNFENQEGPDGPWDYWSYAYLTHMFLIGKGGNKILQDTGNLRQAFRPTNVRRVSSGLLWFNPARTASGFAYAYAHNEGGPVLPARTFMWLSDDAIGEIGAAIANWLGSNED